MSNESLVAQLVKAFCSKPDDASKKETRVALWDAVQHFLEVDTKGSGLEVLQQLKGAQAVLSLP